MDPLNALLFVGIVAAVGAGTWYAMQQRAKSVLNAHVILDSPQAKLGGELTVAVHLRPREAVTVDRVVARTRCLRRSVEGQNRDAYDRETWWSALFLADNSRWDDQTWVEHDEVARAEAQLCGPREFRAGESATFEAKVPVADGVPSDDRGPLTIRWVLEVEFAIPNSPDVTLRKPLVVARRY